LKTLLLFLCAAAVNQAGAQTAAYPAAVATDAQLTVARNRVQTTLALGMAATDTIVTLTSATGVVVNMPLSIDSEIVLVTAITPYITVQRAFDSTAAASHAARAVVSAYLVAWPINALDAEVKAIEATLGPNLGNVKGAALNTASYNFAAQTPGGALIAGLTAITMTPVPQGVNGTDTAHYLYVSGGAGTAQACLISGGTGTAGQSSGSIFLTCPNANAGGWTLGSATSGWQEAIVAAGSASAFGGSVLAPSGVFTTHAPIALNGPCSGVNCYLNVGGQGDTTILQRAADFPTGDALVMNGSTYYTKVELHDFVVKQLATAAGSGTGIHIRNTWMSGSVWRNVKVYNGQNGFLFDQTGGMYCYGCSFLRSDDAVGQAASTNGFLINSSTTNGGTEFYCIGCMATPYDGNAAHAFTELTNALQVNASDGIFFDDFHARGVSCVNVNMLNTSYIVNLHINNLECDPYSGTGVQIQGTTTNAGAIPYRDIFFSNPHIKTYSGSGNGLVAMAVSGNPMRVFVTNPDITGATNQGITVASTVADFSLQGGTLYGNSATAGSPDIEIDSAGGIVSGVTFTGGNENAGVSAANPTSLSVTGNIFNGTFSASPVIFTGTASNFNLVGNSGCNDLIGTATLNAGAITVPTCGDTFIITGTSGTLSNVYNGWAGRALDLITGTSQTLATGGNLVRALGATAAGQLVHMRQITSGNWYY
jgi:hypothetical protein